ncbi:hypothetical protein HMI48_00715 [Acidithiobacillus ferrooxidans]|uniref:hypothetical protein n=1 Tax=Acidithiobacillus ferrooxidans TaxID=920 RepID=UPI001C07D466|nr:hypothetical protein [Acidithiobacillus ferrooxidans]MBU2772483.1 hypothetical protein [Acidithiobacillus ferrooxidans]
MKAGDIVYGPYPFGVINDRTKMKHYCFVLEDDKDLKRMRVCPGTSTGLDLYPQKHEFQIGDAKDLAALRLRKPTRFDMGKSEWVDKSYFEWVSNVQECQSIMGRLYRVLAWCNHI